MNARKIVCLVVASLLFGVVVGYTGSKYSSNVRSFVKESTIFGNGAVKTITNDKSNEVGLPDLRPLN